MSIWQGCSPSAGRASDQPPDVLESRLFHRLLVLGNAPARWPPAWAPLPVLLLAAGMGLLWWLHTRDAANSAWAALTLLAFATADGLVLVYLPKLRISFGPVAPQWYILTTARAVAGCLLALVIPWTGITAALVVLIVVNALALLALLWGALGEPSRIGVSHLTLHLDNPTAEDTLLRLLHISDIHVERLGCREEHLLQHIREIQPDLILLTGDYVNLSCVDDPISHAHARQLLEALCAEAAALPSAPAIYAVLGSPPVDRNSAALFDGLAIRLLRNEVVVIEPHPGCPLALIGLDCTHDIWHDAAQLRQLATTMVLGIPRILLYHSPELMPLASCLGIELYLCGHTHGGQVRLPLYGALVTSSQFGKRYEMGLYREGATHLYVSRGIGFEGLCAPRVRFLCPPEIILWHVTLPPRAARLPLSEPRPSGSGKHHRLLPRAARFDPSEPRP
ncbi:MAG: metallophosphoesterase [Anaerolineae bacterium]